MLMSEAEMNAYRFNSGKEPTDEMLAQIMREVADDAKMSNATSLIYKKEWKNSKQNGLSALTR